MNAAPCNPARLGYTCCRGFENLYSGPRPDRSGFFVPPRPDFVFGLEGRGIPKYSPPFCSGFEPPSRPSSGIASISKIYRRPHGQQCPL